MKLWARIRQMSIRYLFGFGYLFLKNPLLIYPTLRASKNTMKLCNSLFGKRHHSNGKENAFRHALWNLEICENCQKRLKNDQKTTKWAKKVTFLYEKATKNNLLDQAMDLHNNSIGRNAFLSKIEQKSNKKVDNLLKMLEKASKITHIEEIEFNANTLVYISE